MFYIATTITSTATAITTTQQKPQQEPQQHSTTDVFSYNSRKHCRIFVIFLSLVRKQTIKRCYIVPPHLINAFALSCETKNTEIVSFHVNVSC